MTKETPEPTEQAERKPWNTAMVIVSVVDRTEGSIPYFLLAETLNDDYTAPS